MEENLKYFTLSNGVQVPVIGFGTGIAKGISRRPVYIAKRYVKEMIKNILIPGFKESNIYSIQKDLKKDRTLRVVAGKAADLGCRLFDTARAYAYSESYISEALYGNGVYDRESFFLITKGTNAAQRSGTLMQEFEISLKNLATDYVDLYLLHWPQTDTYLNCWKTMEAIYKSGRARAIGVCNCHIHHLEALKEIAEIMPMVNELECHPLLQQNEIRDYCKANDIQVIAHTPTAKMNIKLRESSILKEIAGKYSVEVSQVILRWHYQLGDISIPNTTNLQHIVENLDIWGFDLSESDMESIKALDCNERIWPDPDSADFTKL